MSDPPRTLVYVADNGLVKIQDGINIRMAGLVLESHPAVAMYPNDLRPVGSVDAQTAAQITMLGDSATLPLYRDRITPIGSAPVVGPKLPLGRRPLTDEVVGADIDRALAQLVKDHGITHPSWEQLASAHAGLDWSGMTVGGLRKRRKDHPKPFREKVPWLYEVKKLRP